MKKTILIFVPIFVLALLLWLTGDFSVLKNEETKMNLVATTTPTTSNKISPQVNTPKIVKSPRPSLKISPSPQPSGTPTVKPTVTPSPTGTPQSITLQIEQRIFEYSNGERTKAGISVFMWNDTFARLAREHSTDMAINNFFSHTNLKGEDPWVRATRHSTTISAENIGKMTTGNVIGIGQVANTPEAIAKAQVDAWMNSPGHRQNILNPQYSELGVGTAFDGSSYYLSTQVFR